MSVSNQGHFCCSSQTTKVLITRKNSLFAWIYWLGIWERQKIIKGKQKRLIFDNTFFETKYKLKDNKNDRTCFFTWFISVWPLWWCWRANKLEIETKIFFMITIKEKKCARFTEKLWREKRKPVKSKRFFFPNPFLTYREWLTQQNNRNKGNIWLDICDHDTSIDICGCPCNGSIQTYI